MGRTLRELRTAERGTEIIRQYATSADLVTLPTIMWPGPSPSECFVQRRKRFLGLCQAPVALGSGLARVRNFEANRFPFRAESHFLYFVGRHLEGCVLSFEDGEAVLFAPEPADADSMWHGTQASLAQLEQELQIRTRPIGEYRAAAEVATIAPADADSALWLEDVLGRALESRDDELSDEDAELVDAIIDLRLCHDEYAIAQLRAAIEVTAKAHVRAREAIRVGAREALVRAELEAEFTAAGLRPAYTTICTTEGNVLHHESSLNLMQAGDLLLIDAGCESPEGWASDVTRTWPVSGTMSELQAAIYQVVLQAQQAAIEVLEPGARFRDVHRLAGKKLLQGLIELGLLRGDLDELHQLGAEAAFFPHGLGHLLGLDVHDMEDLGDLAGYAPGRERSTKPNECFLRLDRNLMPGMVVTIEPGFYVIPSALEACHPKVREAVNQDLMKQVHEAVRGIRIEDDVLITEDGCEVLTQSIPKD